MRSNDLDGTNLPHPLYTVEFEIDFANVIKKKITYGTEVCEHYLQYLSAGAAFAIHHAFNPTCSKILKHRKQEFFISGKCL